MGDVQRKRAKHVRGRRAAAAVEFAFVAPVFIVLFVGMAEVGRGIMVQHILESAAREGAREATLSDAATSTVEAAVSNYLANSSVSGTTVSVSPDPPSNAASRQPVTVTVSVPVSNMAWIGTFRFFSNSDQISATASMRRE